MTVATVVSLIILLLLFIVFVLLLFIVCVLLLFIVCVLLLFIVCMFTYHGLLSLLIYVRFLMHAKILLYAVDVKV